MAGNVDANVMNAAAELALPIRVKELIESRGLWAALAWLNGLVHAHPSDLQTRGYLEIIRNLIVRDFLALPKGLDAAPRLSPDFLNDYGSFNLSAQEGYLISLIDGRMSVQQLLRVSPFDAFTTLFLLAKLHRQHAVTT